MLAALLSLGRRLVLGIQLSTNPAWLCASLSGLPSALLYLQSFISPVGGDCETPLPAWQWGSELPHAGGV